jgi:hypothetical protein
MMNIWFLFRLYTLAHIHAYSSQKLERNDHVRSKQQKQWEDRTCEAVPKPLSPHDEIKSRAFLSFPEANSGSSSVFREEMSFDGEWG